MRFFFSRLVRNPVCPALLCALLVGACGASAGADEDKPRAVRRAFLPDFRAQIQDEPSRAPQLLRDFWARNKDQKNELLIGISIEAARIVWSADRPAPEGALQLLDLTIQHFPNARLRFRAVEAKAEILRRSDRLDEAAQILRATWPQVQSRNLDEVMLPVLSEWVEVLRAQKQPEQAIELLYQSLQNTPPLAHWMNFYRLMVDAQNEAGHADEALRWAALFYRVAPFRDDDIARATGLVTRGWLQGNQMDKPALFAAAQSEVNGPNPLDEVAPPSLPAPVVAALRARLRGDERGEVSASRVAMWLMLGDYGAAMLDAREILLRDPTAAAGTSEVARVFKAADGDVARANEFVQFYRTGKGDNPLPKFLEENPPREVPREVPQ